MRSRRFVNQLLKLNDDIEVIQGAKHWEILKRGVLICILPSTFRREGLDPNLKAQFKRAEIRVTKDDYYN